MRDLLGFVADGVWIEPPFFCDYGKHIMIGADSFVNVNCVFLDSAEIQIGANVLIGPGVQLLTPSHAAAAADRIVPTAQRSSDGAETVIGAGSLVTADIPAHSVAFGQPCRVQSNL